MPPAPDRRVNDYGGALTAADRDGLERKLAEREKATSNQVVVALFPSLEGESLEDFSARLAQAWRVGQKGLDNGVVFLVFMKERRMRLEVGYGLEPTLTDATSGSILRDVVTPRFREGRIAEGLAAGLDAIDRAIAGTYRAAGPAPAPAGPTVFHLALGLFVVVVLASILLPAIFTTTTSRRMTRGGWTGRSSGWGGPMIGGGGWGGGRSSGGGFSGGGFSGGGGSFGGGGASGSW